SAAPGTYTSFPTRRSSDLVLDPVPRHAEEQLVVSILGGELKETSEVDPGAPSLEYRLGLRHQGVQGQLLTDAGQHRVTRLHELRSEEHTSELQSRENLVCR